MGPLIRLLWTCEFDEKPAMGYVYDGIYRARKGIKELFKHRKNLYKPYTSIIKDWWNRTLRIGIHVLTYWLNPAFQFSEQNLCQKLEVQRGILDLIERQTLFKSNDLMEEKRIFRERQKTFGRSLALTTCKTTALDEWWKFFGCDVSNLQKLAIRIPSQTSSGCERNWSVFECIHTKKRNRLEYQRLNDLVYVHYNLRLQHRLFSKSRSYDPVDCESIDKTEFWVVEEEQEGELDYDELENRLEEQPRVGEQSTNLSKDDDQDDVMINEDSDFGMVGVQEMPSNNLDEEDWLPSPPQPPRN
ncbi:putative HAT dimerization domain, ribonuclease H-like superfamily [Dioscorea sansibarensis]